jgi:hypothetical protein
MDPKSVQMMDAYEAVMEEIADNEVKLYKLEHRFKHNTVSKIRRSLNKTMKNKFKQSGGAGICDNWVIKLAIKSVILGGMAAVGKFVISKPLIHFLSFYGLDEPFFIALEELGQVIKDSIPHIYDTVSHSMIALSRIIYAFVSIIVSLIGSTSKIAVSCAKPICTILPVVTATRHFSGHSVKQDVHDIVDFTQRKLNELKSKPGAVTRQTMNKIKELELKLVESKRKAYGVAANAEVIIKTTKNITKYDVIADIICRSIDRVIEIKNKGAVAVREFIERRRTQAAVPQIQEEAEMIIELIVQEELNNSSLSPSRSPRPRSMSTRSRSRSRPRSRSRSNPSSPITSSTTPVHDNE